MGAEQKTNRTVPRPRLAARPGAPDLRDIQTQAILPQIEFSMFTPDHLLQRKDLLFKFYGYAGLEFVKEVMPGGKKLSDKRMQELAIRADTHFFTAMANEFGLPQETDPQEFYRTSMLAANHAIITFNNTVFSHEERTVGILNAITAFDTSPSTILYYLSAPAADVDPRLKFEAERQLKLARIAGAIESRARNSGFADRLAKMQQILDYELFEGPLGAGETITSYSWHDDETNSVIKLANDRSPKIFSRPAHLKKHPQHIRSVGDIGKVFADLNSKDIGSAINKAVRKAHKNKKEGGDGTIDLDVAVHDAIRAKMVVQETESIDDPKIDSLIARVTEVIHQHSSAEGKSPLGRLEYIERDDEKNGNNTIRFKRLQIKFADVSTPIEMIFYDQKSNIDEELQVGTRDGQTGHFNGYAHSLYELQRLENIIDIYYPSDVYPPPNGIKNYLQVAAMQREEQIADELRSARRVRPLTREALVYARKV